MTIVCFRKFPEGDVIALFPDLKEDRDGSTILSYQRLGQHAEASAGLIKKLKKATPTEYQRLFNELVNLVGYKLEVLL